MTPAVLRTTRTTCDDMPDEQVSWTNYIAAGVCRRLSFFFGCRVRATGGGGGAGSVKACKPVGSDAVQLS